MPWGAIGGAAISGLSGLAGARVSSSAARAYAREQAKIQREFAQHGIRWKTEDAKAAGLHPLAAIGAQTHSYQPVSVGTGQMGDALANMGQDLGRAVHATQTARERQQELERIREREQLNDALNLQRHWADLEGQQIENQIARQRLKALQVQNNPPFPGSGGSGITGNPVDDYLFSPADIVSARGDSPAHEAGPARPGVAQYRIGSKRFGLNVDLPSEDASEPLESVPMMGIPYMMGHYGLRLLESAYSGARRMPQGLREARDRARKAWRRYRSRD